MSRWKSLTEWYLGLPPTGSAEGTQWLWQLQSPWPAGWPPALAALVAAAVIAGLWWSYGREAAGLGRVRRGALLALRLAAIAVAAALFAQPTLIVARTGLPPVAVLVDTSASMAQPDIGAKSAATKGLSRLAAVQQLVGDRDGAWLQDLAATHPLRLYQFQQTATALGPPDLVTAEQLQAAAAALRACVADGDQTRPAEAVRQVLAELRGTPPTALIVFTDGIASESERDKLSTVADVVRRRGVQLIVVPLGSTAPQRDVQLYDVMMDDVAFVGDPVLVAGKVRGTGLAGKSVTVRLRDESSDAVLAEQKLTLGDDGVAARFELSLTPTESGERDLRIEAGPVPDEVRQDNNVERRHLSVRDEKLRVLLVESAPRYEFRYLKAWLERDTSIQLQTLLVEADAEYAQEDRSAIPYFPVQREELLRYDVVIIGDVSTAQLSATAADWLAEFVRSKGGGLVLIGGPRANPQGFAGSALEGLLPFELSAYSAAATPTSPTDAFHPQLTPDGQKGVPLFRFADSEADSLRIWRELPGFYWFQAVRKLRPGVRVLAEHPNRGPDGERWPIIALQQVGAGKVLWHGTDESWRWRFRMGDAYHGRYWGQALRYLCRARLLGTDRTAELVVDRQVYRRGEPVLLRARFLDDRRAPTTEEVRVVVERPGEGRREVALNRLPHLPSVFETQLVQLAEGAYRAWLAQPSFSQQPPSVDFRVESERREALRVAADRADLELAVRLSGGKLATLEGAARLPSQIAPGTAVVVDRGRRLSLWSRQEPLLLLVGLLTLEWVLRRRWRMV